MPGVSVLKSLAKRPLPPSVRGLKPKVPGPLKKVDWGIDPKQMAAWAGKTASTMNLKYASMRNELMEIKLAAMPKHIVEGWKQTAARLAAGEAKKAPKQLTMKSLGGGAGLISGKGKAALR